MIADIGADVIIHLVSLDHFDSEKDPNIVSQTNVQPTWNLLEACTKKDLKKFVYFSTIHVYGNSQKGILTENQQPTPSNAYGLTHYLSEEICNIYNRRTNTSCINIRLSNSYGEPVFSEANCWDLVINNLCLSAIIKEKIVLTGDGSPIRDFINYKTICESIEQISQIETKARANTFNLSSGISISMLDAAFYVQAVYKKRYHKEIDIYIKKDQIVKTKQCSTSLSSIVSNDYLISCINYIPTPLEEGINSIFNYLDANIKVIPHADS